MNKNDSSPSSSSSSSSSILPTSILKLKTSNFDQIKKKLKQNHHDKSEIEKVEPKSDPTLDDPDFLASIRFEEKKIVELEIEYGRSDMRLVFRNFFRSSPEWILLQQMKMLQNDILSSPRKSSTSTNFQSTSTSTEPKIWRSPPYWKPSSLLSGSGIADTDHFGPLVIPFVQKDSPLFRPMIYKQDLVRVHRQLFDNFIFRFGSVLCSFEQNLLAKCFRERSKEIDFQGDHALPSENDDPERGKRLKDYVGALEKDLDSKLSPSSSALLTPQPSASAAAAAAAGPKMDDQGDEEGQGFFGESGESFLVLEGSKLLAQSTRSSLFHEDPYEDRKEKGGFLESYMQCERESKEYGSCLYTKFNSM